MMSINSTGMFMYQVEKINRKIGFVLSVQVLSLATIIDG